jgi:hypothetical protein
MNLERFRNLVAPVAQLTTVLVVLVGIAVWGYRLQDRVEGLERQVQILLTAPPTSAQTPQDSANAMARACASLVERYASAVTTLSPGSADIKRLIEELGCMKK